MARVQITSTPAPKEYSHTGAILAMTAGDSTNNHYFKVTGADILIVKNPSGSPATFTVIAVADLYGRANNLSAVSVAAGATAAFLIYPQGWMQPDGTVQVNVSASALQLAVIALP
jgi:hypothetical protein